LNKEWHQWWIGHLENRPGKTKLNETVIHAQWVVDNINTKYKNVKNDRELVMMIVSHWKIRKNVALKVASVTTPDEKLWRWQYYDDDDEK
jgi:hypothetical protein